MSQSKQVAAGDHLQWGGTTNTGACPVGIVQGDRVH